jgi:hypothetical protein
VQVLLFNAGYKHDLINYAQKNHLILHCFLIFIQGGCGQMQSCGVIVTPLAGKYPEATLTYYMACTPKWGD